MRRLLNAGLAVLLLAAVPGCASGAPQAAPTPSEAPPPAGIECSDQLDTMQARQIRFGTDGATNVGGLLAKGAGKAGIVFAHQNGATLCSWILTAQNMHKLGYSVLLFDFPGFGVSTANAGSLLFDDNVISAAGLLRAEGVEKIVLMGASLGGTAAFCAAARIEPPVAAVVTMSAPIGFAGMGGLENPPKLTMPVLYTAATDDGSYASLAGSLYDASTASSARQKSIATGGIHGAMLAIDPVVGKALDAFLKAHAPA